MEHFKFQTITQNLFNINLNISNKLLTSIKFDDEKLEILFLVDEKEKSSFNNILTDSMIIIGYITSLFYIILASFQESMLIMTIINLIASTILIICSNISKNLKYIKIFTYLKILLINLNLNIKAIITSIFFNTIENDNHEEIMRVIIYDFFSTNLFILVKLDSHILNYVFYYLLNLITVLIAEIYSNKEHFYYLDAMTGFILFMIFYFLRRQWDLKSRKLFSEKYKYEKLYQYSIDFINGLNGFHINLKNNNVIYIDNKLKNIYEKLDYKNAYKLNEMFNYNQVYNNSKDGSLNNINNDSEKRYEKNSKNMKLGDFNSKYEYFKISNNSEFLNNSDMNSLKSDNNIFLNSLKNKNIKIENQFQNKNSNFSIIPCEKDNEIQFNLFLDSLIYFEGKKYDLLYENLFNDNISLFDIHGININRETPNFFNDNLKNSKFTSNFKNSLPIKNDIAYMPNNDINSDIKNNTGKFKENSSDFRDKKSYNLEINEIKNDIIDEEDYNFPNKSGDNNRRSLLEELMCIQSSQIIIQENFIHLGIYNLIEENRKIEKQNLCINNNIIDQKDTIKSCANKLFLDVFLRKIKLKNHDDSICDIIFYDVTELITTRLKIYDEYLKKQKIFAKLANEFKTPLNSIIGIVNKLSIESDIIEDKLSELKKLEDNFNISENKNILDSNRSNFKLYIYNIFKKLEDINIEVFTRNKNDLNIIRILSDYLIILTSDIIQYTNHNNNIRILRNKIKLKDFINFCAEILKILLNCNKSKSEKIRIIINLDDEIDFMNVYSDEIRLKQILLNFISNSIKFTNTGYISIDCNKVNDFSEMVKISINDSGKGIEEKDKNKIFSEQDIFNTDFNYYIHNNSDKNLKLLDNGFGLVISKNIAKKLDCEVGFISEYGKGSSFFLILPYVIK